MAEMTRQQRLELVEANLPQIYGRVIALCRRFNVPSQDWDDFKSEAVKVICNNIDRFDPALGSFDQFISPCIRGSFFDFITLSKNRGFTGLLDKPEIVGGLHNRFESLDYIYHGNAALDDMVEDEVRQKVIDALPREWHKDIAQVLFASGNPPTAKYVMQKFNVSRKRAERFIAETYVFVRLNYNRCSN